jgi:hypothetical protein
VVSGEDLEIDQPETRIAYGDHICKRIGTKCAIIIEDFHSCFLPSFGSKQIEGAVVDLQLPIQSVPITTDVVISNLDQGEVYNIV